MTEAAPWTTHAALRRLAAVIDAGLAEAGPAQDTGAGRPDWFAVVILALEHGVGGLLHRAVERGFAPGFPASLRMALTQHRAANMRSNTAMLAELRWLQDVLSDAGIETVPLKGVSLCRRLYGDLSSRVSRDIDFLVPEHAAERARAALATVGYAVQPSLPPRQQAAKAWYSGQMLMHRPDGPFAIEPHSAIAPYTLALDIDHGALWRRSLPGTPDTLGLARLAPEDEFVMLCVHGFKEEWGRLKLIVDLAQFIRVHPGLDWDEVASRARRQRVWWIVLAGLSVVASVFGVSTPLTGAAAQPDHAARNALARLTSAASTKRGVPPDRSIYVVSTLRRRMRERRRDQLRYVGRTILTPRENHFLAMTLPDRLFPAYVGVKLLHDYVLLPAWLSVKWARGVLPGRHAGA